MQPGDGQVIGRGVGVVQVQVGDDRCACGSLEQVADVEVLCFDE